MVDIIGQDVGLVPIYPLVRIFSVFVLKIEHNDAQQRTDHPVDGHKKNIVDNQLLIQMILVRFKVFILLRFL